MDELIDLGNGRVAGYQEGDGWYTGTPLIVNDSERNFVRRERVMLIDLEWMPEGWTPPKRAAGVAP